MLVPHGNERVRAIQVSGAAVRVGAALLAVLILLGGFFSIAFFVKQSHTVRAALLARENRLLSAEVDEMRSQMQSLNDSLESLSRKSEQARLAAGLPQVDPRARGVAEQASSVKSLYASSLLELNSSAGHKAARTSHDLGRLLFRAQYLSRSMDQALSALAGHSERLDATPSIAPADGALSSLFSRGRRHPVLKVTRPHKGIDIAAPVGEPILAPAAGRVTHAGFKRGGYGNVVEIDHGYGYVTRFAHASAVLVKKGQPVKRGELIAKVGATGLTSGPHLHYEVEVNGEQVDPLNFIISDAIPD